MGNPKRVLLLVLFALLLVLGFYVIVQYLSPSERADSKRSTHVIDTLEVGSYRLDEFRRESPWEENVLIILDWDNSLHAYLLPTENGEIKLPDRYWGFGFETCSEFGPETDELGRIKKDGVIKCHDDKIDSGSLWEWTYSGLPINEYGIEMHKVPYERVGNKIAINQ